MTNADYLTSVKVEVEMLVTPTTSRWFDITKDVISSIEVSYGMSDNTPLSRVASTGKFTFTLRNDAGCVLGTAGSYSPGSRTSFPGWSSGIPARLTLTYDGNDYVKFYGHISDIQPSSSDYGVRAVKVTVLDWMDYAAVYPIKNPQLAYDKKIEEIVPLIIADMPIKPLATEYYSGTDVFPTVFDTTTGKTKALSEFNKVAISEMGYIYLRKDQTYGETLVVEGRHTRNTREPKQFSASSKEAAFLTTEAGEYLLLETGSFLKNDETSTASFDESMTSLNVIYGKNLINQVSVKSYPRKVDTSDQVLFSLQSPISIAGSETKTGIKGTFRDPAGGSARVTGKDMIAPVGGVDWIAWTNANATGTNITSNITVSGVYSSDSVLYSIYNNAGTAGYVTTLQARGKGIYLYDPVEYTIEDSASITKYSYTPFTLDQKYQDSADSSVAVAQVILNQEKEPRLVVDSINFLANRDAALMNAFMNVDIGDLIYITEEQTGTYDYFYIQSVKFTISAGGIIEFTWGLKDALSLSTHYWLLETASYTELGQTTILGY